jgi:hypothetical protein
MTTLKQATGPNRYLIGNRNDTRGIVAIGTNKARINTTAAITPVINGLMYTKAAMTSDALVACKAATHLATAEANWLQPSGLDGAFYTQPANTTVYYVLCINAGGTTCTVQGTYDGQAISNGSGYSEGSGGVPDIPNSLAPWGMVKVVTGATTFVPATTEFDAASVTSTFYDIANLPASAP